MASARYIQTYRSSDVSIATANTNRDGTTGTYGTVITGVAAGTEVVRVRWMADGTTTAGFIRLFVHDGTTAVMIAEIPIPPHTPVATMPQIPVLHGVWTPPGGPVLLPSTSHTLKASTQIAETFRLLAEGGDYA